MQAGGNVTIDGDGGGDVMAVGGDVVLRGTSRDATLLLGVGALALRLYREYRAGTSAPPASPR